MMSISTCLHLSAGDLSNQFSNWHSQYAKGSSWCFIHISMINAVLFIYLEPDFFIDHDIMVWSPQYLQYFKISCFWSHTFRVKLNCYETVPFRLNVNQQWANFLLHSFSPQGSESVRANPAPSPCSHKAKRVYMGWVKDQQLHITTLGFLPPDGCLGRL